MKNKKTEQFMKRLESKGLGFAGGRLFAKSNIGKDDSDCQKESSCISFIDKFIELINSHTLWAKNIAKTKNSIEPLTRIVKSKNEAEEGIVMTAATDRSVKSAENTPSVFEDEIISLITRRVSEEEIGVNEGSPFGGFSVHAENNNAQSESDDNKSIGNSSEQINFDEIYNLPLGTVGFFENKQGQKESIENQTQSNQGSHINLSNKILQIVNSHFSSTSSILQAINNSTITKTASTVNSTGILSSANITRANPAATLTRNEETTLRKGLDNNFSTINHFNISISDFQSFGKLRIDLLEPEPQSRRPERSRRERSRTGQYFQMESVKIN